MPPSASEPPKPPEGGLLVQITRSVLINKSRNGVSYVNQAFLFPLRELKDSNLTRNQVLDFP